MSVVITRHITRASECRKRKEGRENKRDRSAFYSKILIVVRNDSLIRMATQQNQSIHVRVCSFLLCRKHLRISSKSPQKYTVQGWAKEWALGCVNPASRLPLVAGASSRNLGPALSPSPVESFIYKTLLGILAISRLIVQTIYIYLNKAIYYIPLYCWFKSRSTLYIGCHLLYIRALPLSCFSSQS